MPYSLKKEEGKFCVYNSDTGKKMGTHDTMMKAKKQMALLEMIKHGGKPMKKMSKK